MLAVMVGSRISQVCSHRHIWMLCYLPAVLFPPSEYTTSAITTSHKHFNVFALHTFRFRTVR